MRLERPELGTAETPPARALRPLAICLIAAKIVLLFVLSWNRRFVMDEFEQLGYAKYLPHDLFHTIWPPKAAGFAIFYDLSHVIGWDAQSMLLIGRMQTALLACGTLAMIYAIARTLGESRLRAGIVLLVLLSFSNFIERIFETRAEPLATFFAVAALFVGVGGAGDLRRRRVVAAGVLAGLAFLSTQKSIYFDVALGLALVGDAAIARRPREGLGRGAWLILGWLVPIVLYCLVFGRGDPLSVARNLFLGPVGITSPEIADEYGGLRRFLAQTLVRNSLLYLLCFAGMVLALLRIGSLDRPRRIALIFSVVITALVFAHNQPWPYVFVMALPFVALWVLWPVDAVQGRRPYVFALWGVLATAVAGSFIRNIQVLPIDNHRQLELVGRAEALLGPREVYFDGVGMLPDRPEPSTLWLDRHTILQTMEEGRSSEVYRIFSQDPPRLILWSYRMDAIEPLVGPLIRSSYVQVAPNIRLAGVRLRPGAIVRFTVPIARPYGLYDPRGRAVAAQFTINGTLVRSPVILPRGAVTVSQRADERSDVFLLPFGDYRGKLVSGADDAKLFYDVYG